MCYFMEGNFFFENVEEEINFLLLFFVVKFWHLFDENLSENLEINNIKLVC